LERPTLIDEDARDAIQNILAREARIDTSVAEVEGLFSDFDPDESGEMKRQDVAEWLLVTLEVDIDPKVVRSVLDACATEDGESVSIETFCSEFGAAAADIIERRKDRQEQKQYYSDQIKIMDGNLATGEFDEAIVASWTDHYKRSLEKRDKKWEAEKKQETERANRLAMRTIRKGTEQEIQWVSDRLYYEAERHMKRMRGYAKRTKELADRTEDYGKNISLQYRKGECATVTPCFDKAHKQFVNYEVKFSKRMECEYTPLPRTHGPYSRLREAGQADRMDVKHTMKPTELTWYPPGTCDLRSKEARPLLSSRSSAGSLGQKSRASVRSRRASSARGLCASSVPSFSSIH